MPSWRETRNDAIRRILVRIFPGQEGFNEIWPQGFNGVVPVYDLRPDLQGGGAELRLDTDLARAFFPSTGGKLAVNGTSTTDKAELAPGYWSIFSIFHVEGLASDNQGREVALLQVQSQTNSSDYLILNRMEARQENSTVITDSVFDRRDQLPITFIPETGKYDLSLSLFDDQTPSKSVCFVGFRQVADVNGNAINPLTALEALHNAKTTEFPSETNGSTPDRVSKGKTRKKSRKGKS